MGTSPPSIKDKTKAEHILFISNRIARLSIQKGRLQARLRPVSNELANLRKELEKLLEDVK